MEQGPGGDSQLNLVRMSDLSMGSTTTKDQEQELEESLLEWEAGIQEVIKQELHASPAEVYHLPRVSCTLVNKYFCTWHILFSVLGQTTERHFWLLLTLRWGIRFVNAMF
jgi:hypothetical protein